MRSRKSAFDPADLPLARQEDQDGAALGPQGARDRIRYLLVDAAVRVAPEIARLDRIGAAFGFDDGRLAEQPGDPRAVEGRGHDEEAQILAQAALRIERQREAEIRIEGALVELVEEHGGDAVERGIVEDHAGEHALGHDLDAGFAADLGAEAHAQAHRLADGLAERLRHARGRSAGGEPARLQHDDLAAVRPRARRAAPAAPGWSCRRRAAPRAPRSAARAGSPSGRRGPHRWEGGCRKRACRVMAQAGGESKGAALSTLPFPGRSAAKGEGIH